MKKRILILLGDKPESQSEGYKTYQDLVAIGVDDYAVAKYRDIVFYLADTTQKVYIMTAEGKTAIEDYDLVYLRDFFGYEHERNVLAVYLSQKNTPFVNTDLLNAQHIGKLAQYMQFSLNAIPYPKSVYASSAHLADAVEEYLGEYPAIVKGITASSGRDNYLVRSRSDIDDLFARDPAAKYIAQEFIPNDCDYRFVVLGGDVAMVYRRTRHAADEHRNNVSLGGSKEFVDVHDFSDDIVQDVVRSASIMDREISGVDLMFNSQTNKHVILEVNFNFGIGKVAAGEIHQEIYPLADYLHKKASD